MQILLVFQEYLLVELPKIADNTTKPYVVSQ